MWLNKKSGRHVHALNETDVQQILAFWNSNTTILPNAKYVIHKRVGVKQFDVHATHYLQTSQVNQFTQL
jgi:hypothetical protein